MLHSDYNFTIEVERLSLKSFTLRSLSKTKISQANFCLKFTILPTKNATKTRTHAPSVICTKQTKLFFSQTQNYINLLSKKGPAFFKDEFPKLAPRKNWGIMGTIGLGALVRQQNPFSHGR